MRIARGLRWDGVAGQITGDSQAAAMLKRERRAGYEIEAKGHPAEAEDWLAALVLCEPRAA